MNKKIALLIVVGFAAFALNGCNGTLVGAVGVGPTTEDAPPPAPPSETFSCRAIGPHGFTQDFAYPEENRTTSFEDAGADLRISLEREDGVVKLRANWEDRLPDTREYPEMDRLTYHFASQSSDGPDGHREMNTWDITCDYPEQLPTEN